MRTKTLCIFMLALAAMVASCTTQRPGADYGLGRSSVPIRPRLEVFISPKAPIPLPMGTALLCRLDVPYHNQTQRESLKRVIKGALLQSGLFTALVDLDGVEDYSQYVESGAYEYALEHGLRYCVEVYVEKLVGAVGDSPGFCALSLKIKRAKDEVTIYSVYGEAHLFPKRERDYIFFTTPYMRAPTMLQGIITILRAMSHEIARYVAPYS